MTTVDKCITAKANAGQVDKKKAQHVVAQYRAAVEALVEESRISVAEAEVLAAQQLATRAERDIIRKKRIALSHAKVLAAIRVVAHEAEQQGIPVDIAMQQYLAPDPRERASGATLTARINTVRSQAQKTLSEFLETYRTKNAGFSQSKVGLDDLTRELHGEPTGNASAKNMAEGLQEAMEYLRARFNAAGGDIVERKDWGWFQVHDKGKVAAAVKQDWVKFVHDRLDMAKMLDENGNQMSSKQVYADLQKAYDSIATGGLSDMTRPTGPRLFGSSINKRANSRFLHFQNADAWLEYQRTFGNPNMFDHIVGSLATFSREVAILEILGAHPEATLRFMERLIDDAAARGAISKAGSEARRLAGKVGQHRRALTDLYNTVTGRIAIPEQGMVAAVSQGNRNVVISATLGSAWLVALGDTVTLGLTARMNGMSATKAIARHMSMFSANSAADRNLALQLGFGAQGMASRALGVQRIMGEVTGPELTERLADTAMRVGFLSPWTEAGRWAFGIEMMAHITNSAGRTFDELDTALQGSFKRHGITPQDWDIIRATEQWTDVESGAKFLRAEDVARGEFDTPNFDAANKLQQAIFNETEFAIVSAAPQVRSALTAGAPAGSFWGDVMRNTALFKGFPLSVVYLHWSRIMAMKSAGGSWIQYTALLVGGMTGIGAIAEQMTQLARGKDVLDMDPRVNPGFWPAALAKGGPLGLLGDIVFRDQNRWAGGLWDGLLGPVAGQVEDLTKLTVGNIQEVLEGEDTHIGREISQFVERSFPGRTNWYTRLVTERLIFDELDKLLDPQASRYFRDIERRARKEHKQRFFWHPGRRSPERMPDFSAAIGN
jgi:hypothetical protein